MIRSFNKKQQAFFQLGLIGAVLVFANILSNRYYGYLDLTEEKRFTLTQPTVQLLHDLDEVVYIRLLLDGEFPAEMKRFQRSVREILEDFRSESGYIEYRFENPNEGTVEEINQRRKEFSEQGIRPINWPIRKAGERTDLLLYPYAIMHYKGREVNVNLFESDPAFDRSVQINNSISLLEYKFSNAIQKLQTSTKPAILFTFGNGELPANQVGDIVNSLLPYYNVGPLFLDSVTQISPDVACLIVAKPTRPFSEKNKFKIDQYLMNGGKIIWLIDKLGVALDSLRATGEFIPLEMPLNLDDMLFYYGVKIQPDLILDLQCAKLRLEIDRRGTTEFKDWYYFPLVFPKSRHPIVKNLDRVFLQFPSTIDTVRTRTPVKKTILLSSSEQSRIQIPPGARLNFEILRYPPDPSKFDKGPQNVAVLLEGIFPSVFENRVSENMMEGLRQLNQPFLDRSRETKMIVVSDGDVIRNELDHQRGTILPLGFNRDMRYTFANKDFLINSIEYLLDDKGVIEARTKEVKLRLLNAAKVEQEKGKWQIINILLPILLLVLFGLGFNYLRRRRFARVTPA